MFILAPSGKAKAQLETALLQLERLQGVLSRKLLDESAQRGRQGRSAVERALVAGERLDMIAPIEQVEKQFLVGAERTLLAPEIVQHALSEHRLGVHRLRPPSNQDLVEDV